jgi:hypothetical protein
MKSSVPTFTTTTASSADPRFITSALLLRLGLKESQLLRPKLDGPSLSKVVALLDLPTFNTTTGCGDQNIGLWWLRAPYPLVAVYGLLPFCKHFITSGMGYDCTRISGLLFEHNCSGHNGLFARLFLIALSCSRHSGTVRFCKRRFDLFSISTCCFTIVGGLIPLSQPVWV